MSKRGRNANRERRAAAHEEATTLVDDALVAVGTWFDNDAQCVDGSALLVAVLATLGLNARVQPVHTLAFYTPPDDSQTLVVATSEGAVDFALEHDLSHPTWDWHSIRQQANHGWAGHAVVVVDDPGAVLDPTFAQFTRMGFPDRVVAIRVPDPDRPEDGAWSVQPAEFDGRLLVHYIPEHGDADILEQAATLTNAWQEVARDVARQLRAGGAQNVRWPMTWTHFKTIDPIRDYDGA